MELLLIPNEVYFSLKSAQSSLSRAVNAGRCFSASFATYLSASIYSKVLNKYPVVGIGILSLGI